MLRYLTHEENRGKEMTSRRRFATPQINWLFKRGRLGKDMFLIQLLVNLNHCQQLLVPLSLVLRTSTKS